MKDFQPCMCGDSECPSCGMAQGTLAPEGDKHLQGSIADRFEVAAGFDEDRADGDVVECFARRSQAFREASEIRRRFRWVEVFDRMARRGRVCRWDCTTGLARPVESRT